MRGSDSSANITEKDLNKAVLRSMLLQGTFNYERYQGSGWCTMMAPILEKFYGKDEEELRAALKDNSGFFNTQPVMSTFLQGLIIALYEKKADRSLINNVRISMFGPLAGIGDSIFWFTLMPIMAGLCSSLAIEGSLAGPILYFAVYIGVFLSRFFFIRFGYHAGSKSISIMGEKTRDLSTAASILGVTVVGGLIATLISFKINTVIKITDTAALSVQSEFFDKIIPGILPVMITALMYYLLRKKVSPTLLILGLLVGCLVLSFFGIV